MISELYWLDLIKAHVLCKTLSTFVQQQKQQQQQFKKLEARCSRLKIVIVFLPLERFFPLEKV